MRLQAREFAQGRCLCAALVYGITHHPFDELVAEFSCEICYGEKRVGGLLVRLSRYSICGSGVIGFGRTGVGRIAGRGVELSRSLKTRVSGKEAAVGEDDAVSILGEAVVGSPATT